MTEAENPGDDLYWRFLTFVNYAKAWATQINLQSEERDQDLPFADKMRRRTVAVPILDPSLASRLMNNYARGRVELSRLRRLSESDPSFSVLDSMTIPVHAYYAVHGVGSALTIALMGIEQTNHAKFCNVFTEVVTHLLPTPFNALCEIGKEPRSSRFRDLSVKTEAVRRLSHTAYSESASELMLAKSLLTTRDSLIEEQIVNKRNSLKRKRLSSLEKDTCYRKVSRVSVIDLMWRLRLRSNYGDPYVYIAADGAEHLAEKFCSAVDKLANTLVAALTNVLKHVIGTEKFLLLEGSLPNEIRSTSTGQRLQLREVPVPW